MFDTKKKVYAKACNITSRNTGSIIGYDLCITHYL